MRKDKNGYESKELRHKKPAATENQELQDLQKHDEG